MIEYLMEVSDDGDLEEYDYSIIDDNTAVCERCEKLEEVLDGDEYGADTGIYHCLRCREEIPREEYFKNLNSKGLLKEYSSWIIGVYPQFKKYILNELSRNLEFDIKFKTSNKFSLL